MEKNDSRITLPTAEEREHASFDEQEPNYAPAKTNMLFRSRDSEVALLRRRICQFIHSHNFQIAVIILVLVDCAIVIAEIMLESSKNGSHAIHVTEKALHYSSLTILSLFVLELIVKLFSMGISFFNYKWEVFDAVIVLVSFFLDIFLSKGEPIKDGVEFIILLRLWRITRVINGIIMSVKTQAEEKVHNLRDERDHLEEQVHQLELKVDAQKREIRYLREKFSAMGIDVDLPACVDG